MGVVRVLVAERWGNVRSGFQSQPTLQLVLLLGYWWASHLLYPEKVRTGASYFMCMLGWGFNCIVWKQIFSIEEDMCWEEVDRMPSPYWVVVSWALSPMLLPLMIVSLLPVESGLLPGLTPSI